MCEAPFEIGHSRAQAEMAIIQAFAANVFNICIALGLLWLIQTSAGSCEGEWCDGCYAPSSELHVCPTLDQQEDTSDSPEPGSLGGTVVFTAFSIIIFMLLLLLGRGHISSLPAALFLVLYGLYAFYEVLAQRSMVPTICAWGWCI